MKVTVFNGSPRGKRSNSHQIVEPLLEGAKEAGAETQEVFLIEKDIKYCLGCFACWEKTPGKCAIKDDMEELIELFLESDYVGLATPVYGMFMTAVLKNFTDRFLPLSMPHIERSEDGGFYHEGRVRHMPRQFFIANAGFPGEHNFDLLKPYIGMQGMVLEVYRNCGEALQPGENDAPELFEQIELFKSALKEAGRQMVEKGEVSKETVEKIHMPLMSDEDYMAQANEHWDEQIEKADQ